MGTLYFSFNIILQFLCLLFSWNLAPANFWQDYAIENKSYCQEGPQMF